MKNRTAAIITICGLILSAPVGILIFRAVHKLLYGLAFQYYPIIILSIIICVIACLVFYKSFSRDK